MLGLQTRRCRPGLHVHHVQLYPPPRMLPTAAANHPPVRPEPEPRFRPVPEARLPGSPLQVRRVREAGRRVFLPLQTMWRRSSYNLRFLANAAGAPVPPPPSQSQFLVPVSWKFDFLRYLQDGHF